MSFLTDHLEVFAATAVVALSALLGFLARRSLLARLGHLAEKTALSADDALVASLKRPLPLWFLLGGLYVASLVVHVPAGLAPAFEKLLLVIVIVSLTLWAVDLGGRLLQLGIAHGEVSIAPATGVVRQTVSIAVLTIGLLMLLSTLGISVTPVLTTLGVGGLAVALGLRETLANLFAGMQITLARNIRVGDFIKLESGEEGYVEDIQWRATRVRTLPNNFVLIPNSRLADSVVTNYHLPSKDLAVLVEVGVHYASDLEHVERVTREVASTIMNTVPGGMPAFEPFIRYHSFSDSSIDFTVILRAQEFTDNYMIKHQFIKALAGAFAAEGIVIPFPIRALNLEQEQAHLEGTGT